MTLAYYPPANKKYGGHGQVPQRTWLWHALGSCPRTSGSRFPPQNVVGRIDDIVVIAVGVRISTAPKRTSPCRVVVRVHNAIRVVVSARACTAHAGQKIAAGCHGGPQISRLPFRITVR